MKTMNAKIVATSVLWAAAIIAAALLEAPEFLTLVLLPVLGASSAAILKQ